MSATTSLVSIGQLADNCRRPTAVIEEAARDMRIQPPFKINGVIYFEETDAARIARRLRQTSGPRLRIGRRPI